MGILYLVGKHYPLPNSMKPDPVDEVLIGATVRNVGVHEIKIKVCRRIGIFQQALCGLFFLTVLWGWTFCLTGKHLPYLVL